MSKSAAATTSNEVTAIIENPVGSSLVKYETDKEGHMVVDRFLQAAMNYPGNYGYIPDTLSEDGDPVDILVIEKIAVQPGIRLPAIPIGVLFIEDEKGKDEKVIAVPPARLLSEYAHFEEYDDLPEVLRKKIEHFFKHYKDLEPNKWTKLHGIGDAKDARRIIEEGIDRAQQAGQNPQAPSAPPQNDGPDRGL